MTSVYAWMLHMNVSCAWMLPMPEYFLTVVVGTHGSMFWVQKGDHTWMLVTSDGEEPYLNV